MAGGRRAGSGRPTKAEAEQKRRQSEKSAEFVEGAQDLLPMALETLELLARGIWVEWCSRCRSGSADCTCDRPDKIKLYQRPPDRLALEIIVEHARGKAAQASVVQSDMTITLMHQVARAEMPGVGKGSRDEKAGPAEDAAEAEGGEAEGARRPHLLQRGGETGQRGAV